VPFQHAVQKLHQTVDADALVTIYQNLRNHLSLGQQAPHNVVLTKRWLMVIPRRVGRIEDGVMAANAAVMVGIVWMTKEHEYELWTRKDPMKFLPEFGVPR
jgi:ATP adenylyltransferase/5',5'''-P-1,P-4-tetraphosphate phosphorylase II